MALARVDDCSATNRTMGLLDEGFRTEEFACGILAMGSG